MSTMLGPFRRIERASPYAIWKAVAMEQLDANGATTRWDVCLLHESGKRVPEGPNLHAKPEDELDRLLRALDDPAGAPVYAAGPRRVCHCRGDAP
jgi:hypothetical protein